MKRGRLVAALAVKVLIASVPFSAGASPGYLGARAVGMGGAGRADARGDEGPLLNPAGMSLGKVYTVDGAYQFISRDGGHLVHASVVDSTSALNLAGGLYYNYQTASPAGVPRLSRHEVGMAFSYPFGERVLVGLTGKYLNIAGGPPEPDGSANRHGFTADAGIVLRAASFLTLGVAGYNLHDLSSVEAPVTLGYGIAISPGGDFVIAVDGLHDFTTSDPSRGVRTTVGAGAEYMFQRKLVLRVGGGRDGGSGNGFLSAGMAAVSELGAVDFGFRQDMAGDRKLTIIVVGLRLFVPQP